MNVLEELESIGAVGNASVEEEDEAPAVVAPILPPPHSPEVEAASALEDLPVDGEKVEEILALCDKLLQVFGILARANGELITTVEGLKEMVSGLASSRGAIPEAPASPTARSVTVPIPKTQISSQEEEDIPVDTSLFDAFDLSNLEPSVPLPPELLDEEPAVPVHTIPASPAPPPPPVDPRAADHQLVEQAMRSMGLR